MTVQGYTVTDLGTGSPTLSTNPSGGQVVIAPNGQIAYAFPQAASAESSVGPPLIDAAPTYSPDTNGNPANAFAYIQNFAMNASGLAAILEVTGVNGHWYASDAYYVQEKSDGSWGSPVRIFSGPTDFDGSAMRYHASAQQLGLSITGINNLNQVLGFLQTGPNSWQSGPFVYNINTHTSLQLGNLNGTYLNVQPIAIADNGALLLEGQPAASGGSDHALLLTPDGVSPDPLTVAPEPGGWAVMALAAAAFALQQHRQHRAGRTQAKLAEPR